jgi:hypothetical protein
MTTHDRPSLYVLKGKPDFKTHFSPRRTIMPCEFETPDEILRHLQVELDTLTRVACDMRTILRHHNLEAELAEEARNWIVGHDEQDRRRIAREEASGVRERRRQAGLAKLTMDERRALGL